MKSEYTYKLELTLEESNLLTTYLLMTTHDRKEEIDTWKKLLEKSNDDGTPKYENAKSNYEWWIETDDKIEKLIKKLNNLDSI